MDALLILLCLVTLTIYCKVNIIIPNIQIKKLKFWALGEFPNS